MKDNELRGVILQKYYERRRSPLSMFKENDFDPQISKEDILHISEQLSQHHLIDWKPIKNGARLVDGGGKITADGIDVIENKGKNSSIQIHIPQSININNSNGVQIGNDNTQTLTILSQDNLQLFKKIESTVNNELSTSAEKEEILSKLKALESSLGKPSCVSSYQKFIGAIANHMTILAPFIPALTQLIK
tara:strand:+ start:78 stop:650 length:573 start_codon:yes stop_codon:yes gene_type:complete